MLYIKPPSFSHMLIGFINILEGIVMIISLGIIRPSWSYKLTKYLMFK